MEVSTTAKELNRQLWKPYFFLSCQKIHHLNLFFQSCCLHLQPKAGDVGQNEIGDQDLLSGVMVGQPPVSASCFSHPDVFLPQTPRVPRVPRWGIHLWKQPKVEASPALARFGG